MAGEKIELPGGSLPIAAAHLLAEDLGVEAVVGPAAAFAAAGGEVPGALHFTADPAREALARFVAERQGRAGRHVCVLGLDLSASAVASLETLLRRNHADATLYVVTWTDRLPLVPTARDVLGEALHHWGSRAAHAAKEVGLLGGPCVVGGGVGPPAAGSSAWLSPSPLCPCVLPRRLRCMCGVLHAAAPDSDQPELLAALTMAMRDGLMWDTQWVGPGRQPYMNGPGVPTYAVHAVHGLGNSAAAGALAAALRAALPAGGHVWINDDLADTILFTPPGGALAAVLSAAGHLSENLGLGARVLGRSVALAGLNPAIADGILDDPGLARWARASFPPVRVRVSVSADEADAVDIRLTRPPLEV